MKNKGTMTIKHPKGCRVNIHGVDESGTTWCCKFYDTKEIAIENAIETMKQYGRQDDEFIDTTL
ncbi:hypothetical protein [Bacillus cereus group sp. TH152-1LC]|uniref:hypothetical protein n=1 Tax=Bacillus cereus group sp. TH152-1LC TaxID=3018060 RepID=UPI0022E1B469|nr:hypothetical protein [Bacillus cereus group sp. TH152-1LC]MDA1675167.1 hypothetical protein [Bacillus cereus group sp. TH152-1LC]